MEKKEAHETQMLDDAVAVVANMLEEDTAAAVAGGVVDAGIGIAVVEEREHRKEEKENIEVLLPALEMKRHSSRTRLLLLLLKSIHVRRSILMIVTSTCTNPHIRNK